MRSLVFAVAGLIAGVGAHAVWSASGLSRIGRSPTAQSTAAGLTLTSAPACPAQWQQMHDEVLQAVREGLRQEMPRALRFQMAEGAILPASPDAPETEENRQAHAAETALIDAAIHEGRWTDDDVAKLRAILPNMSATDRPKALAAISKAINDRRLNVVAAVPF